MAAGEILQPFGICDSDRKSKRQQLSVFFESDL